MSDAQDCGWNSLCTFGTLERGGYTGNYQRQRGASAWRVLVPGDPIRHLDPSGIRYFPKNAVVVINVEAG